MAEHHLVYQWWASQFWGVGWIAGHNLHLCPILVLHLLLLTPNTSWTAQGLPCMSMSTIPYFCTIFSIFHLLFLHPSDRQCQFLQNQPTKFLCCKLSSRINNVNCHYKKSNGTSVGTFCESVCCFSNSQSLASSLYFFSLSSLTDLVVPCPALSGNVMLYINLHFVPTCDLYKVHIQKTRVGYIVLCVDPNLKKLKLNITHSELFLETWGERNSKLCWNLHRFLNGCNFSTNSEPHGCGQEITILIEGSFQKQWPKASLLLEWKEIHVNMNKRIRNPKVQHTQYLFADISSVARPKMQDTWNPVYWSILQLQDHPTWQCHPLLAALTR